MCGLNAIFAYGQAAAPVLGDELVRVREAMHPRGPDDAGLWVSDDGRVGLGHRRLAIIDLSDAGAQPMRLSDDPADPIITFNGEIYNYRELRAELKGQGSVFRSHCDTEVLLHLYRRHDAAMSAAFDALYASGGRESIPPERLLRGLLLQAFYSIRSERQRVERIELDLLFR